MALRLGELTVDIGADTSDLKRAGKEVNRTAGSMEKSFKRVGSAIVAALSFQAVKSVALLADSMNMLDARIRNLTNSAKDFQIISKGIRDIAKETGGSIQSIGNLAQNLLIAGESIGATSDEVIQMTSSLNKLGQIGGSSAEQMSNAMLQFGQAMAGGVVRAEEFNSIIENTPLIAREIAKGMGLNVGELRKMVIEGKILSEDVFKSLQRRVSSIDKQFKKMPLTISRTAGIITNVLTIAVQKLDEATGATLGFASGLNDLADELIELIDDDEKFNDALEVTKDIATGLAIILISRLGVAFSSVTEKIVTNTLASRAATIQARSLAVSESATAASALIAAKAHQAFSLAVFNAAKGSVGAKIAADKLIASNIALAAATKRASIANINFNKTITISGRALGFLAKAGKGFLAIFGGVPGIIFTVVTSLIAFVDWSNKSEKASKDAATALDIQKESFKGLNEAQRSMLSQNLTVRQTELIKKVEEQRKVVKGLEKDQLELLRSTTRVATGAQAMGGRIEAATENLNLLQTQLTATSSELEALFKSGLPDLSGGEDGSIGLISEDGALDKEISKLMELIETYGLTTEALNLFNAEKLITLERSKLSKDATEKEIAEFNKQAQTILNLTKILNKKIAADRAIEDKKKADAKKKADERAIQQEKIKQERLREIQLRQRQDFASDLGFIFGLEKEAAIGSATLGLASAISKAFAQQGPLAFGSIAAITAEFANLFSAIKSAKGPGRQAGGNVSQGVLHPVNENGQPELLVQGAKQFLLSGQSGGQIIPATSMRAGGGGGLNVTVNNNAPDLVEVSEPFVTQGELMIAIDRATSQAVDQVNTSLASGRGEAADSVRTSFNLTRNI